MKWDVEFYDTKVMKSIYEWPIHMRAKFTRIVELIKISGPNDVGMPHIKSFGKGLFEIRAKSDEGIGRAIFCVTNKRVVIILTGFIKKTQKTPAKEIEIARQRMKGIKNDE